MAADRGACIYQSQSSNGHLAASARRQRVSRVSLLSCSGRRFSFVHALFAHSLFRCYCMMQLSRYRLRCIFSTGSTVSRPACSTTNPSSKARFKSGYHYHRCHSSHHPPQHPSQCRLLRRPPLLLQHQPHLRRACCRLFLLSLFPSIYAVEDCQRGEWDWGAES